MGFGRHHFSDFEGPHLTQSDLISLYVKCGEELHKGSLRTLAARRSKKMADFREEIVFAQRLFNLLGSHATLMQDESRMILCNFGETREAEIKINSAVAI